MMIKRFSSISVAVLLMVFNFYVHGAITESYAVTSGHGTHTAEQSHDAYTVPEPSVDFEIIPAGAKAGTQTSIFFLVKDSKGRPLKDLVISHERILHVIIVSRDFSIFAHLHPEDFGPVTPEAKEKARYEVRFTFPKAGEYLIAADLAVKDRIVSRHFKITIQGEPSMSVLKKDFSRERYFGDYQVMLIAPEHIAAGRKTVLKYKIFKNGKPLTDIEPYLAAPMHLAVILTDLKRFLHAHGYKPGNQSGEHPVGHIHGFVNERYGPEIEANIIFPEKGTYKILSEIKRKGKVMRFDFLVNVE